MSFYQQIQRSIDYCEQNLHSILQAEKAAEKAYMSQANFFRYFKALTGFSFMEYIRKRRLTESLPTLESGQQTILEIALSSGFQTHESYTRAFRNEFGITPSAYRKSRLSQHGTKPKKIYEETKMGIEIKELPAMKAASYRVISRSPEKDAWIHLKGWADKNGIMNTAYRIFGFNNPGPETMQSIIDKSGKEYFISDPGSEYGYEFLITLPKNTDIPEDDGVVFKTIPAGRFAVMSIGVGCEQHDIEKGWGEFNRLIQNSGYRSKERWMEEHLDFTDNPESFRMDLYVEIE